MKAEGKPRVAILKVLDLLSFPSLFAGVAKLVYALDSKSSEVKLMSVRVRPPAPNPFSQNRTAVGFNCSATVWRSSPEARDLVRTHLFV